MQFPPELEEVRKAVEPELPSRQNGPDGPEGFTRKEKRAISAAILTAITDVNGLYSDEA